MDAHEFLAKRFEANRPRLQRVAYRMLGSANEAEDAVQEAWLRLSRAGAEEIDNLGGWLTTVVARVCLDMLRSRKSRREEPLAPAGDARPGDEPPAREAAAAGPGPGAEMELAESVGLALLVVLQTLAPAERVAFVLHDMFDLSFDEIAPIVGRTPTAARQLASRARRRVQGKPASPDADLGRRRAVVDAFLTASRDGDFEGLLAVLDPEVMLRADPAAIRLGTPAEMRGAQTVATAFKGRAKLGRVALIDGAVGVVVAPRGHLMVVLLPTVTDGRITALEAVADPERLARFAFAVL